MVPCEASGLAEYVVMHAVYRPAFGRVLTVVTGMICVVTAAVTAVSGGFRDFWQVVPWLALLAGGCWATFWRPRVEVSDGGVRIVNVTRTIDLPWPAIEGVETRWALTLVTAYGRFTAWAAPSAGRAPARRAARVDLRVLGRSIGTKNDHDPDSSPGAAVDAAGIVRARWEQLRAAGHLDNPVLERDSAPVRWHVETIAIGAVLVLLAVIGAVA